MKEKKSQMLTSFVREDTKKRDIPADFGAMANLLTVLTVMAGMAVYYYGKRALTVTLISVGVCWLLDTLCLVMRRKTLHIHDLSPIITGLTIAVMLPASVPYTVAAAAGAFAICIAKHPLGRQGKEILSPAAAGYIFAELCWPSAVLSYPKALTQLSMQNLITEGLTGSFTATAMRSTSVPYTDFELLIGKFPGPMGCCFTILTAVCALYLISRKTISGCVFFSEIITVLGIAALRGGAFGLKSAAAGGMLIFGAAIFSAHRGSAPKTAAERLAFGLITGLFVSAVAAMSSLENPAVYAAIICAPVARLTDKPRRLFLRRRRAKRIKETEAAQSGGAENG